MLQATLSIGCTGFDLGLRLRMLEQFDCDPSEIVNLNGAGPMSLGEAIRRAMEDYQFKGEAKPRIFRKRRKVPQVLELTEIQQLAEQAEFIAIPDDRFMRGQNKPR